MTQRFGIRYREVTTRLLAEITDISGREGHVKKLEFFFLHNSDEVDLTVRYFQRERVNLELCLPHIAFSTLVSIPLEEWPSSIPPREEGLVVPYNGHWIGGRYEYTFVNEPSGRKFRVQLVICSSGIMQSEVIDEFHLLF